MYTIYICHICKFSITLFYDYRHVDGHMHVVTTLVTTDMLYLHHFKYYAGAGNWEGEKGGLGEGEVE